MAKIFPIRFVPDNTNFDFIGRRWISFSISIILTILSIFFLATKNLNYGIDFAGGALIEAKIEGKFDIADIRNKLSSQNIGEVQVQTYGAEDIVIKVKEANQQMKNIDIIKNTLTSIYPDLSIDYRRVDYVGPQIGKELINKGILATMLSLVGIMIYIWIRFNWQYGIGLLIALAHDAILTLGFMSITKLEFNLTSIASILTIIGYSVNDSVVIYDRIRENYKRSFKSNFKNLLNDSINNTLSRTIMTVTTTLLSALSLIFFGGEAIKSFSIVVFFGIIIGTYSSIFLSAPVLVYLKKTKA